MKFSVDCRSARLGALFCVWKQYFYDGVEDSRDETI